MCHKRINHADNHVYVFVQQFFFSFLSSFFFNSIISSPRKTPQMHNRKTMEIISGQSPPPLFYTREITIFQFDLSSDRWNDDHRPFFFYLFFHFLTVMFVASGSLAFITKTKLKFICKYISDR